MGNRRFALSFAILLAATVALAQGTYTQIDVPGAAVTLATGINKAGEIVGSYVDALGGHGFLLQNGVFTTIDYPGVQYSYAERLNDKGQIVGLAEPIGYVYDVPTQTFTAISYPGAAYTFPLAINNTGTLAGYYQVIKNGQFVTIGFEMTGSTFRDILPPGADGASPQGITIGGRVVGYAYFRSKAANLNFGVAQSQYRAITIPNAPGALVYGVNPEGTAVIGTYDALSGLTGFVYQNGILQSLSFPGSITTEAYGINAAGQVVGYFIDSSFQTHGFLWTP
jgi:probable HAF family extracellular repeat protein